nr:PREDICTED: cingulin-like [Latimeria chalumnae]|eukprot:XP_014343063.1 PREDICTED: cingulin-like [Latimeria chalumnae]
MSEEENKHKQTILSIEIMVEILERLKTGKMAMNLSKEYGIRNVTTDLKKNTGKIQQFMKDSQDGYKARKVMHITKDKWLYEAVYAWFIEMRKNSKEDLDAGPQELVRELHNIMNDHSAENFMDNNSETWLQSDNNHLEFQIMNNEETVCVMGETDSQNSDEDGDQSNNDDRVLHSVVYDTLKMVSLEKVCISIRLPDEIKFTIKALTMQVLQMSLVFSIMVKCQQTLRKELDFDVAKVDAKQDLKTVVQEQKPVNLGFEGDPRKAKNTFNSDEDSSTTSREKKKAGRQTSVVKEQLKMDHQDETFVTSPNKPPSVLKSILKRSTSAQPVYMGNQDLQSDLQENTSGEHTSGLSWEAPPSSDEEDQLLSLADSLMRYRDLKMKWQECKKATGAYDHVCMNVSTHGEVCELTCKQHSKDAQIQTEEVIENSQLPRKTLKSILKKPMQQDYQNIFSTIELQECLSPAVSEQSIEVMSSQRSASLTSIASPQSRSLDTNYNSWQRLQKELPCLPNLRPGVHSRRDYIQELMRLLDISEKRNADLEAERVEMARERRIIALQMRGLILDKEDLMKRLFALEDVIGKLGQKITEKEKENEILRERIAQLEDELNLLKQTLGEADDGEHALYYLYQSLKRRLEESKKAFNKQTQEHEDLYEKLWQAERDQDQLRQEKKNLELEAQTLSATVQMLEKELAEALQASTQAATGLILFEEFKQKSHLSLQEVKEQLNKETITLKDTQQVNSKLQEELSNMEKELEIEVQAQEKLQLQTRQMEQIMFDLQEEMESTKRIKDNLEQQLKHKEEELIKLEVNLEDFCRDESEWKEKHKKATEKTATTLDYFQSAEKLQSKLHEEQEVRESLELEKVSLKKQNKELWAQLKDLECYHHQTQENLTSKAELRIQELEESLQIQQKDKVVLLSIIHKLEMKAKELSVQMEEEQQQSDERRNQLQQFLRHKDNEVKFVTTMSQNELLTTSADLLSTVTLDVHIKNLKQKLSKAEEVIESMDTDYKQVQREREEQTEFNEYLKIQIIDLQKQLKQRESSLMMHSLQRLNVNLDVESGMDEENGELEVQNDNVPLKEDMR